MSFSHIALQNFWQNVYFATPIVYRVGIWQDDRIFFESTPLMMENQICRILGKTLIYPTTSEIIFKLVGMSTINIIVALQLQLIFNLHVLISHKYSFGKLESRTHFAQTTIKQWTVWRDYLSSFCHRLSYIKLRDLREPVVTILTPC